MVQNVRSGLLFNFSFKMLLWNSTQKTLCYCHICFNCIFTFACYVCTAVSQQAYSALKDFPSFCCYFLVFCYLFKLCHGLWHWSIGNVYLSDIFPSIIPLKQIYTINHEMLTDNWNIITYISIHSSWASLRWNIYLPQL